MIQIDGLCFRYSNRTMLFQDFDLRMKRGSMWSVIGPSGCGKSSLLYLLAGLRFPESGSITIGGKAIKRPRPETGLVLQDHGLLPWATVWENVALGFRIRKFYGPDGRHAPSGSPQTGEKTDEKVRLWLERLNIAPQAGHYPAQLSRGQRQRAAIARTMVLDPDLMLLDEPFSALDAPTREELQQTVMDLNRRRSLTCVMVTHDIEEAVTMGRHILILKQETNRKAEILENPLAGEREHRRKKEFFALCETLHASLGSLL